MRFVIYNQAIAPTTAGVYTSLAVNTAFNFTFYRTFTIGLNMVNQLFDIHNKFYTAAFTK